MQEEISVLLVDDHELLAESLAVALDGEVGVRVVGVANDVEAALALLRVERPDVVLLDALLGPEDGVAAIPRLLEAHPMAQVIVMTGTMADHVLLAAMDMGVAGFLSKTEGLPAVIAAVRGVAAGESVMSSATLTRLLPLLRRREEDPSADLTRRELEVLGLVAHGWTNAAIAEELTLSLHTVRNHVATLSRKLGAHSKLEALAIGLRRGLVDPAGQPTGRSDLGQAAGSVNSNTVP